MNYKLNINSNAGKGFLISSFIVYSLSLVNAQTKADSIAAKCVDALGGKAKLESIHSLYKEGTYDASGNLIVIKSWAVNNKDARSESMVNGMTNYTIIRNDSGWFFSPESGQTVPEPLTSSTVKQSQFGLNIQCPLLNYKQKGYTLTYLGIDDELDGSDAYKLLLKVNDSLLVTYYVDPDSYLIICAKTTEVIDGRTRTSSTFYSDYEKTPDGYWFPMETGGVKYKTIKVNPTIDPSLFKPGKGVNAM